jgi:CDP-diacylglycerol pyrophosphatase
MWVSGEHLKPHNPLRLLAEGLPDAAQVLGDRTLVVIGLSRSDGVNGFVILTDRASKQTDDLANGGESRDNTCHIAVVGRKGNVGPIEPRTE